jgi:transcriptional regulator with XRE-family HTH domain
VRNTLDNQAYKKLRELLRGARENARITQVDLSARLKRPQSFVSKYERGERQLDLVEFGEISRALGIDPVRFLRKFYEEIS